MALLEGLGVDVLGIDCGLGPEQMKDILADILKVSSTPVLVNPNAGLQRSENGKTVYDVDPEDFAAVMEEIVKMGAGNRRLLRYYPRSYPGNGRTDKGYSVQLPQKRSTVLLFLLIPGLLYLIKRPLLLENVLILQENPSLNRLCVIVIWNTSFVKA